MKVLDKIRKCDKINAVPVKNRKVFTLRESRILK